MRPPALSEVFSSLVPLRVEISASESMEEGGCSHVASVCDRKDILSGSENIKGTNERAKITILVSGA